MTEENDQFWQQAEQCLGNGDRAEATRLYAALAKASRMHAPHASLRLSLMSDRQHALREATAHALDAMQSAYPDPDLLCMLGKRLLTLGEYRAARSCGATLLAQPEPGASNCAELGKLMSDHMQVDMALRLLDRAHDLGLHRSAAVQYLRGLNAMYAGHDAAEDLLRHALRLDPNFHLAHWSLAKLGGTHDRPRRVETLRGVMARLPEKHPDLPLVAYSLFQELDAADEVGEAWQVLEQAMHSRRQQVIHDADADDKLHGEIRKAWPTDMSTVDALADTSIPVFVIGMPRTGTTLLERELVRATGARAAGELRDFIIQMRWLSDVAGPWTIDHQLIAKIPAQSGLLGERYRAHTAWRAQGAAAYIDKWPDNYKLAGWIRSALPEARIVHVRRDPMATCFANLKEWFGGNAYAYSYDQNEVARQFVRHDRLMQAFTARSPALSATVAYEDLVANTAGTIARLLETVPLPLNEGDMPRDVIVGTASAVQVRQPVHQRSVAGWRRYARYLAPLQDALSAQGYDVDTQGHDA